MNYIVWNVTVDVFKHDTDKSDISNRMFGSKEKSCIPIRTIDFVMLFIEVL